MESSQALIPGSTLFHGSYRIDGVLGQGGFGITYLATDLALERKVAVKEFFPREYCDRDGNTSQVSLGTQNTAEFVGRLREKFLKEARKIAGLNHPHIIRILSCFEEHNTAYYVMDHVDGMNLSDTVKANGPLPVGRAAGYIARIGEALTYIHNRHITHLDVKPGNIMLRVADDTPVLIDFGLAKQYDGRGNQTSTTPTGISKGYAPLEQYQEGGVQEFSPQTDLYALAATFYYLLTGVVPPQATDILNGGLTFPEGFPPRLMPAFKKAMDPIRHNRHASVAEFIAAVNATIAGGKAGDAEATVIRGEIASTPAPGPTPGPPAFNGVRTLPPQFKDDVPPDSIVVKANIVQGINAQGGNLTITPTQLLFRPHKFNKGHMEPCAFDIKDIKGFEKGALTFLSIHFNDGSRVKLTVWNRDEIIRQINLRRDALRRAH